MKKTTLLVFIAASLGFASVAHAESARSLLNTLPKSLRENSQTIFSANTVWQLSLNSQYKKNSLDNLLSTIRADLTKAGYCEEPIRTNVTRGTFSASWAPPKGTTVDGTSTGNYAVLATQAVMLDQSTINLNTSLRDVLAGDQAVMRIHPRKQTIQAKAPILLSRLRHSSLPLISSFSELFLSRFYYRFRV